MPCPVLLANSNIPLGVSFQLFTSVRKPLFLTWATWPSCCFKSYHVPCTSFIMPCITRNMTENSIYGATKFRTQMMPMVPKCGANHQIKHIYAKTKISAVSWFLLPILIKTSRFPVIQCSPSFLYKLCSECLLWSSAYCTFIHPSNIYWISIMTITKQRNQTISTFKKLSS